jgi:PHP family Zn ribbon phosphoesterase
MIPPDLDLDAVEISRRVGIERGRELLMGRELTLVTNSDAHALDDVGRAWGVCEMRARSFAELALALRGQDGRRVAGLARRE